MARSIKDIVKIIVHMGAATLVVVSLSVRTEAEPMAIAPATIATTLTRTEWTAYTHRFIRPDGRVIDVEKGGQSHSEGQGYGMLLAMRANDQPTFDRILAFTFGKMRARSDGLVSWLYNPHSSPPITDPNNASDGDILIAYALISAGLKWNEARYIAHALPMIDAIGSKLLERRDGYVRLKPGAFGFDPGQHPGGAVVNLSYYIYGAFLLFEAVDQRHPWREAWQSGLMLTEASLTGSAGVTPDWIALEDGGAAPARGFKARSSYDAVRVPLYMALGGRVPARYFASFDRAWNLNGRGLPKDYDLEADRALMDMNEPGYRAIAGIAACASRGVPVSAAAQRFQLRTYFSSTLHLLALSALRSDYRHCTAPAVAAFSPHPLEVASAAR
ncbi:glycosyl hydrolase family 8 [Acuticoccus yangtzensis]|uniref:glycosyl hydrolase family 8 n=1 Tax=Acuticoccus yangtzensis TaxID=1443441 RepID=UPI00094984C2|nr:glycosyl hydrolase family 8 [Acuticoccus yangtzensis]